MGPLCDFLVLHACTVKAMVAVMGLPQQNLDPLAPLKTAEGSQMLVPVHGPIEVTMQGREPEFMMIIEKTDLDLDGLPGLKGSKAFTAPGFIRTLNHLMGPIFIMFFEAYNDWLDKVLGDAVNWPPTLNFARVIRNCAAHHSIKIRNPGAPAVTWRTMSYGYKDNGRNVIAEDFELGDLVALMLDVDAELDALGAPIL